MSPRPLPVSPERGPGLATAALRGAGWVAASRFGGKLLFFASTVVLARLLDPRDFGVAAYAITVIALFGAIPGLGLAPALIHHRDEPEVVDTGFWLGVGAGIGAFLLLWLASPLAGLAFGDPRAVDVTRALALVFPLESLRNVHAALLRKRLDFRRRFVPELVHSLAKGLLSIALALGGFGYWSLIVGTVGAAAVAVPVYWIVLPWRPRPRFHASAARRLLPFGSHVIAVDLLGSFVRNVDYLVVGRVLGAATLGVYVLAFRIPDLLIRNLSTVLGQVLLPVYARVQHDRPTVHDTFVASTSYVFALTAPLGVGLALLAEPLVVAVFSDKWLEVVPVLAPIAAYAVLGSLSFNVGDLLKALGRPDALSRISLLRAVLVLPAVWIAVTSAGTPAAVGWAQAGVAAVAVVASFAVAHRLFALPIGHALGRLAPVAAATAVMTAAVLALDAALADRSALLRLVAGGALGAAVYGAVLRGLARDFFDAGAHALLGAAGRRTTAEAT